MNQTDNKHLKACLAILHDAILTGRLIAWAAEKNPAKQGEAIERLADLLDAMHNIPSHAVHDPDFREWSYERLREWENRWNDGNPHFTSIYDRVVGQDT